MEKSVISKETLQLFCEPKGTLFVGVVFRIDKNKPMAFYKELFK